MFAKCRSDARHSFLFIIISILLRARKRVQTAYVHLNDLRHGICAVRWQHLERKKTNTTKLSVL